MIASLSAVLLSVLRLLALPFRAPMLLVLGAIAVYEGLHWSRPLAADSLPPIGALDADAIASLFWSIDCLHALVVVVVCTMPDLLLRQLSSLMASSRVMTLVVTLLLAITGGLYLLHLNALANMLILASAVLLARLDLARVRVVPPPQNLALALGALVLLGATLGRWLAG